MSTAERHLETEGACETHSARFLARPLWRLRGCRTFAAQSDKSCAHTAEEAVPTPVFRLVEPLPPSRLHRGRPSPHSIRPTCLAVNIRRVAGGSNRRGVKVTDLGRITASGRARPEPESTRCRGSDCRVARELVARVLHEFDHQIEGAERARPHLSEALTGHVGGRGRELISREVDVAFVGAACRESGVVVRVMACSWRGTGAPHESRSDGTTSGSDPAQ